MVTPLVFIAVLLPQFPKPAAAPAPAPTTSHADETPEWRQKHEAELKADRGWLSVSGLPWLKEGPTSIGSAPGNTVRLADGPAVWGSIVRVGASVELHQEGAAMRPLTPADPPFQIGRTWVQLIKRGDLVGLRLWDPQNARKLGFPGLQWYEIKPSYRIQGRLIASELKTTVKIANVIGQVNDFVSPGVVEFELDGKKLQITPVYETKEQTELFYIFKDGSSGKTTYGAGRFVYSGLPDKDGRVILDFNRAYSPPCAFTDFATCPLPPSQNRLAISIEAGEKDPHKAH